MSTVCYSLNILSKDQSDSRVEGACLHRFLPGDDMASVKILSKTLALIGILVLLKVCSFLFFFLK